MPLPGKVVWVRDWNPSERTYRRIRAFLERSIYWKYRQSKTSQATASRGNVLVNTIMALAVISPLSFLQPIAPNHSPFHLLPTEGRAEQSPLHQITEHQCPGGCSHSHPELQGTEKADKSSATVPALKIHLLSIPRQRQQEWIPTSPPSLREIY